jgi:hypothetical protein
MRQNGLINPLVIICVVLSVLVVGLGGFGIWSYVNYLDQKDNTDAKITAAVTDAKKLQNEADNKDFTEREKFPTKEIIGPDDLGRVSVSYPKTWSVYLDRNGDAGQYEAYFHPGVVPALASKTPYALRLSIVDRQYDIVVSSYQDSIKKGLLSASSVAVQGVSGVRLDGFFSGSAEGSMVIFKVRDKTVMLYTENKAYVSDFDNIALKSLSFNK